jgi:hypothetical protein
MAKIKIPMKRVRLKGWPLVFILGLLLALVAVIDRGGLDSVAPTADGSTGCELRVTVPELNVRSGPSQQAASVQTLAQGATVDGTNVLTAGFRQLKNGNWVFDQYVTPIAGSTCT